MTAASARMRYTQGCAITRNPNALAFGEKSPDRLAVDAVGRWPPQADASRLGCPQSRIDPFADYFPLELRHGHQDAQLQPACRVVVARVDPLTCADERDAMRRQLCHELRQMRQAATKPVQLVNCDCIDAALSRIGG